MTFVFLHVDRTGGMAVRELLARQFRTQDIRPVPHDSRASVRIDAYPIDRNSDLVAQNRSYVHQGHALVMGHWDWGVVERIPGPVKLLTILRDPVERAVSLWRFVKQERGMYCRMSQRADEMGCIEWLAGHPDLWANVMTQQLAGTRWSQKGRLNEADVEIAVDRLLRIEYVGVTEYLTGYMDVVCAAEGWHGRPRQINGTKRKATEPNEVWELVYEKSQKDVWLYNLARRRCARALQSGALSRRL